MRQWFRDPRTLGPNRDITLYEANLKTVLRCLDRAGARLMLGVDSGFRYLLPGFSIHDELRLIVESGLSPYKALRMATVEPAVHLNRSHEMGTVEAGKIADFLLLEANPLEDVANAKKRAGVMLGGAWLDETWLRNRLEEIALSYTGRVEPVPTSFPQPPSSHAGG
jgi:imidazolonepropionase-like amidohydrolase